jgi:hypothetical protein
MGGSLYRLQHEKQPRLPNPVSGDIQQQTVVIHLVVKNNAEGVPGPGTDAADAGTEIDAVVSARPRHGPMVNGDGLGQTQHAACHIEQGTAS